MAASSHCPCFTSACWKLTDELPWPTSAFLAASNGCFQPLLDLRSPLRRCLPGCSSALALYNSTIACLCFSTLISIYRRSAALQRAYIYIYIIHHINYTISQIRLPYLLTQILLLQSPNFQPKISAIKASQKLPLPFTHICTCIYIYIAIYYTLN